jgi:hypothetical protein
VIVVITLVVTVVSCAIKIIEISVNSSAKHKMVTLVYRDACGVIRFRRPSVKGNAQKNNFSSCISGLQNKNWATRFIP